jgi:hypothetical protein
MIIALRQKLKCHFRYGINIMTHFSPTLLDRYGSDNDSENNMVKQVHNHSKV